MGYINGVLSAPDPRAGRETGGSEPISEPEPEPGQERPTRPLPVLRGPLPNASASVLDQRLRLLEMSSVFWQLGPGLLRSLALRMRDLSVPAGQTLKLQADARDAVIFLSSGTCDRKITDPSGTILLMRRSLPGAQVVLPPPAARGRYTTTIRAVADAAFVTLDRDSLTQALRGGLDQVTKALDQLWDQEVAAFDSAEPGEGERAGAKVIAFCSAKGGSGASVLAVNTAAALAAGHPGEVVLLDLSAPYGHAVLYADLVPTGSLVTAASASAETFGIALRGVVAHHRSGLSVLPGALRPEEADLLTGELVARALNELGTIYRVVVADLGTSLAEGPLTVIERSRRLVLVVPPEVAALTDARRALGVFTDLLQVPDNRIDLVLNQRVPHPPLDRSAMESVLGRPMSLSIGYDGAKPEAATLAGGLVLQRDRDSTVARGAVELAKLLTVKLGLDA